MNKLFALLGKWSTFRTRVNPIKEGFTPYADPACNRLYNELFCDKLAVFRGDEQLPADETWATLLAKSPQVAAVRSIAEDQSRDSRVRALAYCRLREMRQTIDKKELLGVVTEVGTDNGLAVLAGYRDGRVFKIDPRESIVTLESSPPIMGKVRALMNAAQIAVDRIGPWLQPRVAPPTADMIRMSFLVSDGLYFGQGLTTVMHQDELASPIIEASEGLRQSVSRLNQDRNVMVRS